MKCIFRLLLLFLLPLTVLATPTWKILPGESTIEFTAIQNGAPVTGQFKSFSGNIVFDPAHLKQSHVKIIISLASVSTSLDEVAEALKSSEWFDANSFPQAIFKASSFIQVNANTYKANGTLTIRNKTLPLSLLFSLDKYTNTQAVAKGNAVLKRTQFDIGKGEWSDTESVKDEVRVNFVIKAIK